MTNNIILAGLDLYSHLLEGNIIIHIYSIIGYENTIVPRGRI
jgi:hypothetical protein